MVRRLAILLTAVLPLLPLPAEALSLRDIVELTKAGLSDDVLLALIEVDRPVFAIDNETLKSLKAEGVSEQVMIAIIRSGRTTPPAPALPAPQPVATVPPVVIVEQSAPEVREVVREVAVPVYVPVVQVRSRAATRTRPTSGSVPGAGSPYYVGQVPVREPRKKPEPVYWGWGGKLRPDAWKPAPDGRK